ncbi:aldo/keto reductase [Bifidobacterium asteroides]|uniref:aldo/keto reductase n=1 Tax=Bifidobacterium asteroides TaxID=1684 RepID=UPI0021ACC2DD|nr:aldo/keto reductase [Bifidobacterium asteroides]
MHELRQTRHHARLDTAEEGTDAVVANALDLGITFFDTANGHSAGTSEEYLGKALRKHTSRDRVVIASKVYFNEGRLSSKAIHREIDGTLKRLGASAMYASQFQDMQKVAQDNGWTPFSAMENHYNLLYREDEKDLIHFCRKTGVSLMPYSPLAAGHLIRPTWTADTLRSATDKVSLGKYDRAEANDLAIIGRLQKVAERHNVPMARVAIAWQWAEGVASPIIGATKARHLDDAAAALDLELTSDEIASMEEPYLPHETVGAIDSNPPQGVVLLDAEEN